MAWAYFTYRKIDWLKDCLWGVQFKEEHYEDAMIWQLLKVCCVGFYVMNHDPTDKAQHLKKEMQITYKI